MQSFEALEVLSTDAICSVVHSACSDVFVECGTHLVMFELARARAARVLKEERRAREATLQGGAPEKALAAQRRAEASQVVFLQIVDSIYMFIKAQPALLLAVI